MFFSFCHWEVKSERKWKDAEALGVVSFHGNGGVWKGLLAFAAPVVYNIQNWLGLMRRRSANHNSAPPHPSPTCHNNAAWNDAQFIYEGCDTDFSLSALKLMWLIDRGGERLSELCLSLWLLPSLISFRPQRPSLSWVTFVLIIIVIIQGGKNWSCFLNWCT